MKRHLTEQTILFVSVLKWFVLATVVGVIVGFAVYLFLRTLEWGISLGEGHHYYFLFLPLGLLLSYAIAVYLAPDAEGHGTDKVITAVHRHSGKIKTSVIPVKFVATVITCAAGGAAGKECPCAQMGAGLSSLLADIARFNDADRKKLVICGISAGFAAAFGTPIAGAIFGIEVLYVGGIFYEVLLPSFVSGIVAYQVSSYMGITYFRHAIEFLPVFSELFFIRVALAGVFLGICSMLLIEGLRLGREVYKRLSMAVPVKIVTGGIFLVALTLISSTKYLGLGLDTISSSISGEAVNWYDFILKIIFVSVTLNFGGSGGIVTPIFFIGATAGSFFGRMLGLDTATFAAIGLAGLLAGAANTPLAASILAVELFGSAIAPYAAIASVISFIMTGHRSVYPSQILSIRKSASLDVELGKTIEEITPGFRKRDRSFISLLGKAVKGVKEKFL